jgi:hypothetical protein
MKRPQPATAADIYEQIADYCRQREADGASWAQNVYKEDFFKIFYRAYYNGVAGWRAKGRYATAYGRNKTVSVTDHDVNGYLVEQHLATVWRKAKSKRSTQMVSDLVRWWDDWTYAWDHHPAGIPRKYHRNRN